MPHAVSNTQTEDLDTPDLDLLSSGPLSEAAMHLETQLTTQELSDESFGENEFVKMVSF